MCRTSKMELIRRIFFCLSKELFPISKPNFSRDILYKIVDKNDKNDYLLQCVNSKSIFQADINEIVFDNDILYGLHPLQSCFIGIEYARHLKNFNLKKDRKEIAYFNRSIARDYGSLELKYQNRRGDICYIDSHTKEEFVMNPKEIAFSDEIIERFHAYQAFYIGLCAGLKIYALSNNVVYLEKIHCCKIMH